MHCLQHVLPPVHDMCWTDCAVRSSNGVLIYVYLPPQDLGNSSCVNSG